VEESKKGVIASIIARLGKKIGVLRTRGGTSYCIVLGAGKGGNEESRKKERSADRESRTSGESAGTAWMKILGVWPSKTTPCQSFTTENRGRGDAKGREECNRLIAGLSQPGLVD